MQLGDAARVAVMRWFSAGSVLVLALSVMKSWRLEGGRVKRRGRGIFGRG